MTETTPKAKPLIETQFLLTIKHAAPLPELFKSVVEARAFDWLTAKNVRVTEATLTEWTEVKEGA